MHDPIRVVITGLGTVTPLGNTPSGLFRNITEGKNGVADLTKIDGSRFPRRRAAEVKGFASLPEGSDPSLQAYGMSVAYAIAAARMALEDGGLDDMGAEEREAAGVLIGTTMGNQDIVERINDKYGLQWGEPLSEEAGKELAYFRPVLLSAAVADRFGLGGPTMTIPTACAAGNYAVGTAFSMIRQGKGPVMLAGGADPFTRACYTIFHRLGASTADVCKPFDRNRTGMAVGEGAAVLVLEELRHARKRGARIYAEVTGYALSCDAYHPTSPHPEGKGAIEAMETAMRGARLDRGEIDYINAHGTGTQANDKCEAVAMARVFRDGLRALPVSSVKSMLGHCMGAASAMEAAICAMALERQVLPPTINTRDIDPDFPIPFDFVPEARPHRLRNVISNAFAFGGNVSSLVLSRFG
jgi:3-oxoacyl-[acyl-carrier-protein] synthase II